MAILEKLDVRRYRRMHSEVHVRFRGTSLRRSDRDYLQGIVDNLSLGGMFIATATPPREGSLVTLEFDRPAQPGGRPVRAKALVCWRRRWRGPRGMGVRFVEFENLGPVPLASWLDEILAEEPAQGFPELG